ncbi:hypothetical protein L5515_013466 [Caenorhabditis briggsae]|uniref:Uncharacterized protein n=1 Tax=Caenorhabditis briggsae TaxID=6238 RepID=A0AAE9E967_CAEBR|nr:hypothetical protein L5515_013466 [Caenorhabditis briggsae]
MEIAMMIVSFSDPGRTLQTTTSMDISPATETVSAMPVHTSTRHSSQNSSSTCTPPVPMENTACRPEPFTT